MIWVALAGVAALVGASYYPVTADEAWSLVVARRMLRGERLYRDIFYGAAPLAVWFQAITFRLLRPQGIVVRGLTVGYFCAAVWAAATLMEGDAVMAATGAVIALGAIHVHPLNHYSHLTSAATLWAAVAVIEAQPWLAGLLAGVSVLGRYSVGVITTCGMAVAAGVVGSPTDGAVVLATAIAPLVLLAIARPSAARWFIRRAVVNKRGYIEAGGERPTRWLRHRRWSTWDLVAIELPAAIAIVVVIVAPAIAGWQALTDASDASVVGLTLTVIAASMVSPRFDGPHAVGAMLVAVPGALLSTDLGRATAWVGAGALALAAFGIAGRISLTRGVSIRRDLPSLRYLPVTPLRGNVWPDETIGLPSEVFVFRIDAAMVYACGNVANPTPFDYPGVTTFGPTGQAEVIRQFESGMPVCHGWTDPRRPPAPPELDAAFPREGGTPTRLGRVLSVENVGPASSDEHDPRPEG